MKSSKLLVSFVWYCLTHKKERFWQALRNWSGRGSILITDGVFEPLPDANDTFYSESRTGL